MGGSEKPLPRWKKNFRKWESPQPLTPVAEVDSLLRRVFGERVQILKGTSHNYLVDVGELKDTPGFEFGYITIPIRGGQGVKAFYLTRCFQAAVALKLFDPSGDDDDAREEDDE